MDRKESVRTLPQGSDVLTNTCSNIVGQNADCEKNNPCPGNTQCCQEINKNGSKGPITCCANGSCNSKLGHCSIKTNEKCPNSHESFDNFETSPKQYCDVDKACANYKFICIILSVLCAFFIFAIIIMGFKLKSWKCMSECMK